MRYYILCFGRTDFTKFTVDSIRRNAELPADIYLINNGWNESIVPREILRYWIGFVELYQRLGLIQGVFDFPAPSQNSALNSFSKVRQGGDADFYWITDNDCIVNSQGFDRVALSCMEKYRELPKLGIDFYRRISLELCEGYPELFTVLPGYLHSCEDVRIVEFGSESEYSSETGSEKTYYKGDPRISNNFTDTTLSIVRGDVSVSQFDNRISYSISGLDMLHVGYLEPIYFSINPLANYEMLHYVNVRPHIMTEWRDNYEDRRIQYVRNLVNSGHSDVVDDYNRILGGGILISNARSQ